MNPTEKGVMSCTGEQCGTVSSEFGIRKWEKMRDEEMKSKWGSGRVGAPKFQWIVQICFGWCDVRQENFLR